MKQLVFLILLLLFPVSLLAETLLVKIDGMTCDSCAKSIKSELRKLEQVQNVQVSFSDNQAAIELKEGRDLSYQEIETAIEKLGYEVSAIERDNKSQ